MKSDKSHIPLEILLHYINGLSENTEKIKNHLNECDYCSKIKENLLKASTVKKQEAPSTIPDFTGQEIYSAAKNTTNKKTLFLRIAAILIICLVSGFLFVRFITNRKGSRKYPSAVLQINKKILIVKQGHRIIIPHNSLKAALTFKDGDHLMFDRKTECIISGLSGNKKGIDKFFHLKKGRVLVTASNIHAARKLIIGTKLFNCTVAGTIFLVDAGKRRVSVSKGRVNVTTKSQITKIVETGKALSFPKRGDPVLSNLTSKEKTIFKRAASGGSVFQENTSSKKTKTKTVIEFVYLKNGKILKGFIIKRNADSVILKTGKKKISIPVHNIERIQVGK